ncbi:hypothetical protein TUM4261_26060 [Shewanella sp. c952]|uniref:hypothetical protein n=1 Tax=Shewanella sp. c952 TaxID=2815913 RepID=UPI001BC33C12|nr:hypothetical protein [Shewanella sp. c952]GIU12671.1 hypothetical protein TUM4261_26060 [Shewanella sp. c952]
MLSLKRMIVLHLLLIATVSATSEAAITITELQPIKYPSTVKNQSKSTIVVVNWKGNLGNATNATLLDNDYYQGKYLVSSDSNLPITIEFFQLANESKVNLKTLRVRYKNKTYKSFPTIDLDNPGADGEIIAIGAKVVAGKNATAGDKNPQYILRIEEQQ